MNDTEKTVRIAIYLHGDALDPDVVTELVGASPSRSRRKGEKYFVSPRKIEVTAKSGLWVLTATSESEDISSLIKDLSEKIGSRAPLLAALPGVDEAYVDVFYAVDADEDGGGTATFWLNKQDSVALNSLGLPIQFTVTVVETSNTISLT